MGRRWEIVLLPLVKARDSGVGKGHSLILAEDRSQSADLSTKSSANMLRLVCNKLFYAGHHLVEEGIALQKSTEP